MAAEVPEQQRQKEKDKRKPRSWMDSFIGRQDWRTFQTDWNSSFKHASRFLPWWFGTGAVVGFASYWRDAQGGRTVTAAPAIGKVAGKYLAVGSIFHGTEALLIAAMGRHHWTQQTIAGGVAAAVIPAMSGMQGGRGALFRTVLTGMGLGAFMGGARGVEVQQSWSHMILLAKEELERERLQSQVDHHDLQSDPLYKRFGSKV